MSASLGRITARLIQPAILPETAELIELINKNINPPTPLRAEEVYIGVMRLVSDEVNSFGGRFPAEEHERLARLLVDSPVLAAHRKDTLPVARTFHAEVEQHDGKSWVKSYFYWLKNSDEAETLKRNIDGGIYKECSIGFTFRFPECSLCGQDIRTCPHEPLRKYPVGTGGEEKIAYFNYRQIERVLETSLVYRGANPDTSIRRILSFARHLSPEPILQTPPENTLQPDAEYLVVPYYDALPVILTFHRGSVSLRRMNGESLSSDIGSRFSAPLTAMPVHAYGHLVGYRGKERCSLAQLERYLAGESSSVTRLEAKLFPPSGILVTKDTRTPPPYRMRLIRHRIVAGKSLPAAARTLATRRGVRYWRLGSDPLTSPGHRYMLPSEPVERKPRYRLTYPPHSAHAFLSFNDGERDMTLLIRQFHLPRLMKGGRFIADVVEKTPSGAARGALNGVVTSFTRQDEGRILTLTGALSGTFHLQPVKLDDRTRYLFYRRKDG